MMDAFQNLPGTFRAIDFEGRSVAVCVLSDGGLGVVDALKQGGIEDGCFKLWRAYENKEVSLHSKYAQLDAPTGLFQVGLALRGYAAFLDPSLERPSQLDELPMWREHKDEDGLTDSDRKFDKACEPDPGCSEDGPVEGGGDPTPTRSYPFGIR